MELDEAFADAMETADVVARKLERELEKLRVEVDRLTSAVVDAHNKNAQRAGLAVKERISRILAIVQTPELTRWRMEHNRQRDARKGQQATLERKLAEANRLLDAHGISRDSCADCERP